MKDNLKNLNSNLFLSASDTELAKFCEEVFSLGEKHPEIHKSIESDQDALGKKKKLLRELDRRRANDKTSNLPTFETEPADLSLEELTLETGKPRMKPELVLLFSCFRGCYASVTDRDARDRIKDSLTLYVFFSNLNMKIPASTTILENINRLSRKTRDLIPRCQLEDVMDSGLDDFTYALFDSASVQASSRWPTDAGVIYRLLERVYVYGRKLEDFGVKPIQLFYLKDWLPKLKKLLFKINNARGTRKLSKKKKLEKLYGDYLKTAHKAYEYLVRVFESRSVAISDTDLFPSSKPRLRKLHGRMEEDLLAVGAVLYYTEDRIFNGVALPSSEKILSLSDETAAFIKKGQRNPVIGYKPQLAQSGNGFVTGVILEQGNTSDSSSLFPLAESRARNTGVVPKFISADDGYSSRKGRAACLEFGVENVCLSGAVGKKIISEELWESEMYTLGRRKRSAVESLMFTLKYVFEFGRSRRRGLENVKAEMTEEIIAYNIRRKISLQERQRRDKEKPKFKKSA